MDYDIVVGVCTKDCEDTISDIVKKTDRALKEYKDYNTLILCADGFSKDKTKSKFNKTETNSEKKFVTEKGKRGKGSAVKTIIHKAKSLNARIVLVLEGDNKTLKKEHINKLINPVIKNDADVVLASYIKHKNDALIDNHLIYPLTKALFNVNLRQPMAGDYCLSHKSFMKLLNSKFFPADHGIDIFITISSLCEGMNVSELKLGTKHHESSKTYSRPEDSVMPLFNQVMREYIQLIRYYKNIIRKETSLDLRKIGRHDRTRPQKIDVSIKAYEDLSRNSFKTKKEYSKLVYEGLNDQSIMALKVAWLNWLAIYFNKTKNLSNDKAEKEILSLEKAFNSNKDLLNL